MPSQSAPPPDDGYRLADQSAVRCHPVDRLCCRNSLAPVESQRSAVTTPDLSPVSADLHLLPRRDLTCELPEGDQDRAPCAVHARTQLLFRFAK